MIETKKFAKIKSFKQTLFGEDPCLPDWREAMYVEPSLVLGVKGPEDFRVFPADVIVVLGKI